MKFIWAGDREKKNGEVKFVYKASGAENGMIVCAADFFRVWIDGKFASYGPERTAAGYARKRKIIFAKGVKEIAVYVSAYNVPCYCCDMQLPYFAAEIYSDGKLAADSGDFKCFEEAKRIREVPRYSTQRGFSEAYDCTDLRQTELEPYGVKAPKVINGNGDTATYETVEFDFICKRGKKPFDNELKPVWWEKNTERAFPLGGFNVTKEFVDKTKNYVAYDFSLPQERTGFLQIEVDAGEDTEIYAAFEEILPDGKWLFRRSENNDFVRWKLPKGKTAVMSSEPYAMKYLRIYSSTETECKPKLVLLENSRADCVKVSGNEKFKRVFEAANATFKQNAVDVFTDCPGRERAGWLCDSYFTGIAERLFTGKNDVEKLFLQNFIIGETSELDERMTPQCFPAQHGKDEYIPNWAMWFVAELYRYCARTGDEKTAELAKDKVYGIINFFEGYVNELGLLENLQSWVFVEWSVCNDKEYVEGVNYPSNMTYALMLECAGLLYKDDALINRANKTRAAIRANAFNGEFFADNSTRDGGGKLVRRDDHITETCQYYALFCGVETDEKYRRKMAEEFGPFRKNAYPAVARSNAFIGNYLRYFWLCEMGEYERVINESLDYFSAMAEKTGTLWEHDLPVASCNHGFASVIAVLLLRCATGYVTVNENKPVFSADDKNKTVKDLGITVEFEYNGVKTTVSA